ncbi:hypothetical protein CCAX7_36540 [Capsulimonas corticalis]|uniref:Uncharacterized protein n=1 Tax=Capsulimonas corticalis TaxID=2219043 RepID=A0A402D1B4_9BACT|nr:hypothetical protein CCAX7_36540 [Capsulimonas corticalis]
MDIIRTGSRFNAPLGGLPCREYFRRVDAGDYSGADEIAVVSKAESSRYPECNFAALRWSEQITNDKWVGGDRLAKCAVSETRIIRKQAKSGKRQAIIGMIRKCILVFASRQSLQMRLFVNRA